MKYFDFNSVFLVEEFLSDFNNFDEIFRGNQSLNCRWAIVTAGVINR